MEKLYDYEHNLIQPNTFYKNYDMTAFIYSQKDKLYCEVVTESGNRFGPVKLTEGNSKNIGYKCSPETIINKIDEKKKDITRKIGGLEKEIKGLQVQQNFIKENKPNKKD
ncbi:hypothetical protein M0R19_02105 [Candidatus Pacearchaeota archaeon]|nr:hypothetical protein [Candidatus Pacearchaeota archaeon]